MTDHRSTPDDPPAPDEDGLEPVSGEPLDATFEVEHAGEGDDQPAPSDEPEPVESAGDGEDAEFELAPQMGESPPPMVAGAPGHGDDDEWPWDTAAPAPPRDTTPPEQQLSEQASPVADQSGDEDGETVDDHGLDTAPSAEEPDPDQPSAVAGEGGEAGQDSEDGLDPAPPGEEPDPDQASAVADAGGEAGRVNDDGLDPAPSGEEPDPDQAPAVADAGGDAGQDSDDGLDPVPSGEEPDPDQPSVVLDEGDAAADVVADLGFEAVPVPESADRPDEQAAGTGEEWDPPPGTDALFAPGDFDEAGAGSAPGGDQATSGADDRGFDDWRDGLEPFPGPEDEPYPADEPAGPMAVAGGPSEPRADAVGAGTTPPDDRGEADQPDDAGTLDDEGFDLASAAEPVSSPGLHADVADDEPADWATFTDEHYIQVSQSDYRELADLTANVPDAPPGAVAASIPGVDTGMVGLEDVVDGPAPEIATAGGPTATELGLRVLTGIGLLVLFAAALVYPLGLTLVAIALFGLAAGEFYAVLVRNGQHPLSLFGLLGAAGGLIGSALWGLGAVPVAIIASLVAVALYYALTSAHPDPLTDGGLTVTVVAWALLGAFVFPIVDSTEFRWWIAAIVVLVVVMDVGQYFVGRSLGSRPLAPVVSPKKTIEGLVGGAVVTVVAAVVLSFFGPLTLPSMLALAAATIVLAPLGDLSVSLVKRIIGVKDMGTVLPGHGGILDRVDGLLFVIPAAWVIFDSMGLLT